MTNIFNQMIKLVITNIETNWHYLPLNMKQWEGHQ